MNPRVVLIFGTRPEAIKMLPVARALRGRPGLEPITLVTGQHREMLAQVLDAFDERVDLNLDVMRPGQGLADLTSRLIEEVSGALRSLAPDLVLVHGDTTTAMAAALAAFYLRLPVGHVEAGLRSHDMGRPWPEEFNRVAVDALATLLFAPTETAADNLRRESPRVRRILVTGNTGIDALLYMAARTPAAQPVASGRRSVLVTAHRRESFGAGFEGICNGIARIAARTDVEVTYPVHLNPEVREATAGLAALDNVRLIEPVGYREMVGLMKGADVILTDSGGIQEEGPALGKPVLVLREVTERPEALATGVVSLVGSDPERICIETFRLLDDAAYYRSRARPVFPYGDGAAAQQIADAVEAFLARS